MEITPARPAVVTLAVMLATIMAGLAFRFAALGLPFYVVKYGGSAMWALMGYWIVSAILPQWRILPVALLTGAIETAAEYLKLWHTLWLDTFRHTLPGIILLGSYFSYRDIVAYWLAIFVAASLDQFLRSTKA